MLQLYQQQRHYAAVPISTAKSSNSWMPGEETHTHLLKQNPSIFMTRGNTNSSHIKNVSCRRIILLRSKCRHGCHQRHDEYHGLLKLHYEPITQTSGIGWMGCGNYRTRHTEFDHNMSGHHILMYVGSDTPSSLPERAICHIAQVCPTFQGHIRTRVYGS